MTGPLASTRSRSHTVSLSNRTSIIVMALSGYVAAAQSPPPRGCDGAEHHQLDFWIGNWAVTNTADGVPYGTSRIESAALGCAIRETYDAPAAPGGRYVGTSYSSYDAKERRWRQFYIDSRRNVTLYRGALDNSAMEFTAPGPSGAIQKMIYRPEADGSIRQVGTLSTDGGRTWRPNYDYTYRRTAAVKRAVE